MDYVNVLKKVDTEISEVINKDNLNDLYKNGYTLIKKDKKNNKIIISEPLSTTIAKKRLENKILNNNYSKMIYNWEKYRNNVNNLKGDLSEFINNDLLIEKMVNEENKIQKEIYELVNKLNIYESDNNSDEENNNHLIF